VRKTLLDTFETVYSLRTLQTGAVVRAWPRPYSVWQEDSSTAAGYSHAGSTEVAPSAEMIRNMIQVNTESYPFYLRGCHECHECSP
jgi:hypothetical protein